MRPVEQCALVSSVTEDRTGLEAGAGFAAGAVLIMPGRRDGIVGHPSRSQRSRNARTHGPQMGAPFWKNRCPSSAVSPNAGNTRAT
jgi:hypothetical protein